MTVVFSDDNRVTWFVCSAGPSRFCPQPTGPGGVTFQRAGRRDMVLAQGKAPSDVSTPAAAKTVFERCPERRWAAPGSDEVYRIEDGEVKPGGRPAYRLTSEANVHVLIPADTKPVGLLTDEEIAALVAAAF